MSSYLPEVLEVREVQLDHLRTVIKDCQTRRWFRKRRHVAFSTAGHDSSGLIAPHQFEAWADVPADLKTVRWFSGGSRLHSVLINNPPSENEGVAIVSGQIAKTQRVSKPVQGVSFRGAAREVPAGEYRDKIIQDWIRTKLFKADEVERYLASDNENVPSHQVYELQVDEWRMMDTRQEPRLVVIGDLACSQWNPDVESRFGMHMENPHLHLPLTLK